jgi:hypothetical protein
MKNIFPFYDFLIFSIKHTRLHTITGGLAMGVSVPE